MGPPIQAQAGLRTCQMHVYPLKTGVYEWICFSVEMYTIMSLKYVFHSYVPQGSFIASYDHVCHPKGMSWVILLSQSHVHLHSWLSCTLVPQMNLHRMSLPF